MQITSKTSKEEGRKMNPQITQIQQKLGSEWAVEEIAGGLKIRDKMLGDIYYVRNQWIERLGGKDEDEIVDALVDSIGDAEPPAEAERLIAEGEAVHYQIQKNLANQAR